MKKGLKYTLRGLMIAGFAYLGYFIVVVIYSHSADWKINKEYMWLFKGSAVNDIDTFLRFSYVEDEDVYNNFHYKDYNVIIWEFKNLKGVDLNNIIIKPGVDLSDDKVSFRAGQIINKKGDIPIAIRFRAAFSSAMSINIDDLSQVHNLLNGRNYKGFYGDVSKFSLSNETGEHQIIADYAEGKTPTLFLAYSGAKGFFLIIVNSKHPISEDIFNIFNLE